MVEFQSEQEKLEKIYELSKDQTRSEVYLISANSMRVVGIVRLLLAEMIPDRVIEHPLNYE